MFMKKKLKLKKKGLFIIGVTLLLIMVLSIGGVVLYSTINGVKSKLTIHLIGEKNITLEVGSEYKDKGSKAYYDKKDISSSMKVKGHVDTNKIGEYKIIYTTSYKKVSKSVTRKVKVVDTTKPEITLTGEATSFVVGGEYSELGYSATDNYDGDITTNVTITNNIDSNTIGEYEVTYTVKDSSGNESIATRKVNVISRPATQQKIAVLNYHFFFDSSVGDVCNDGNCEDVKDFREQLDYLRDNNYKTLTMKEFRDWMYGAIEIPDKSVLITVDDGAMGTGKENGNKLIPILEEYKMHATLFLITGWWDINNYKSDYLDIESHTHNMHTERFCEGVTRGAQMLCQSNEEVLNDLKTSISVTNSKLAFCFPFYAYNDNAIRLVQEAGFELAFIGGGYKVSRSTDKYHIPRYQIKQSTSLQTFINYVS